MLIIDVLLELLFLINFVVVCSNNVLEIENGFIVVWKYNLFFVIYKCNLGFFDVGDKNIICCVLGKKWEVFNYKCI